MFILSAPITPVKAQKTAGTGKYQQISNDLATYSKQLREENPDVVNNLFEMSRAVFAPGALDTKTKELICLGIAVANRCDGCIASHTRASVKAGATREEIIEALGVAVLMGGGPSYVYSTHVLEVMDEMK
ncbi:MAG: carboxymuconolactone decarboxylase family protein [Candidatus Latescibacteria bacterium]|nr:carboxymuconolactone decarboxylase family protein [Candidatus Latescibacterota bacterium]